MQQLIINLGDKLAYLESLSQDKFIAWLDRALQGDSSPLWLHDDVYFNVTNTLKNNIVAAINLLTVSWTRDKGYEYLGELIYILGITGISYGEGRQAFDRLLDLLEVKELQGIFSNQQYALNKTDIHLNSLRSMNVLARIANPRLREICNRDIKEDSYFGICYHILSTPENTGFESLIFYFPDFIRFSQKKSFSMFLNNFWWIYKKWGERLLCDLNVVLSSLSLEEKDFFWAELQNTLDRYAEADEKKSRES